MTTEASFTTGNLMVAFTYGPEMARYFEELVEDLDWLVEIAVRLTPPLIPFLDEPSIRLIVDHVALRFRWHRERTPTDELMSLDTFIERYIERVKAEAPRDTSPTVLWREYASRVDPVVLVAGEARPSGVTRHLRCYEPCCLDDPHAEMVLAVRGEVIGGTTFDRRTQWSSWGPAGDSQGHPTRSAAEVAQINAHLCASGAASSACS